MLRNVMKAAMVAIGLLTAAPLMAQQPAPIAPAPQHGFVARPGRAFQGGPRRRRIRRHRRRIMMRRQGMRRMGMGPGRAGMMRMRAMRMRYFRNRSMI